MYGCEVFVILNFGIRDQEYWGAGGKDGELRSPDGLECRPHQVPRSHTLRWSRWRQAVRLQNSATMGSSWRLASSFGTKASTEANAWVGTSLPESKITSNSGRRRFIARATSSPFMPGIS